jgi:magnesium transporter
MYADDAADLVEEMPASVVKRILKQASPDVRRDINELLKYPEDSAGSIMTPEFADLHSSMTAAEALDHIRLTGVDKETIDICYVIEKRRLIGLVSLRTLVLANARAVVSDLMDENVISVGTLDDIAVVADMFAKYDLTVMPVVDGENRLVGIVTVDDAIDVMRDEATEDIEKMAAITPSDKPYPRLSVMDLYKSRIPWLLLLMLSAVFTQLIIGKFEAALAANIILTSFIPMLMDTGGNSGSQSSVTIIRSLSLAEIRFSDIFRIMFKEMRVALLCGATLAVVNFGKLMLFDRLGAFVSLTVSLTLLATVVVAKFFGCTLPLLVKKIGLDPAVMASPIITTIVDAIALLIYFAIASAMLGI